MCVTQWTNCYEFWKNFSRWMVVHTLIDVSMRGGIWYGITRRMDMDADTITHCRPRCTVCACRRYIHKGPAVRMWREYVLELSLSAPPCANSIYPRNHDVNLDNDLLATFRCTLSHFSTLFGSFRPLAPLLDQRTSKLGWSRSHFPTIYITIDNYNPL